ncbi:hypothetical protein [Nocardiopsis sp. MG754419]|uniref:hypothetical protein n=1 Tax=Nocardiopsis sp. MG754419 TaxID=2259865 RepID=UPI001BA909A5|nr:hypothetical protein [Nocardiopsis sp. MG754419]MBR8741656.1 hypothetical protein [Nocardiopsis sp. MG754419]
MAHDYDAWDAEDDGEIAAHLLWAAVQEIHGDAEALCRMTVLHAALGQTPNMVGVMSGWVAGAELMVPMPVGMAACADREPRTGHVWELENIGPGTALGHRVFAALANRDTEMTAALWQTANTPDGPGGEVAQDVLLTVLNRCALVIAQAPREGQSA